jgi:hypothetical protein
MNVLTVVSPFQNYRMKLLELMSLTAVSMTLALGIMDEPDPNAAETNDVSSLSALIIAVNVVFALCVICGLVMGVLKKRRKKLRTKQLWGSVWGKKDLLIAILKLGSPQCCDSSSSDTSTESLILPTTQAQECTALEIEMSNMPPPPAPSTFAAEKSEGVSQDDGLRQTWPDAPVTSAADDDDNVIAPGRSSPLPDFEAPAVDDHDANAKGLQGWKRLANTPAVKIKAAQFGAVQV